MTPFLRMSGLLGLFVLFGCGGEGSNEGNNSQEAVKEKNPTTKTVVHNTAVYVPVDTSVAIDLTDVKAVEGSNYQITHVEALSHDVNCIDYAWQDRTITLNSSKEPVLCNFEFTIASAQRSQMSAQQSDTGTATHSAILRVATTTSATTEPPEEFIPLGHVAILNSPAESVDLAQLISSVGDSIPLNAVLSTVDISSSVGGSVSIEDADTNTISYTSPTQLASGNYLNRILFSYKNESTSEIVKIGVLDIALSESANKGITLDGIDGSGKYHYVSDPGNPGFPGYVVTGKTYTVDLDDLLNDSDTDYVIAHDSDVWSIGYASAFHSNVTYSGKELTFSVPAKEGLYFNYHYANFSVVDNKGAMEFGLLKFTVLSEDSEKQLKGWQDVVLGVDRYSAPFSTTRAQLDSIGFTNTYTDSGYSPDDPVVVATFTPPGSAETFCNANGQLPAVAQLEKLADNYATLATQAKWKWPAQRPYLAKDGTDYYLVDLSTPGAAAVPYQTGDVYNVTCMTNGYLRVSANENDHDRFDITANGTAKAKVVFELLDQNEVVPDTDVCNYVTIKVTPVQSAHVEGVSDKACKALGNGRFEITLTNTNMQIVAVTAEYESPDLSVTTATESATAQVYFGLSKTDFDKIVLTLQPDKHPHSDWGSYHETQNMGSGVIYDENSGISSASDTKEKTPLKALLTLNSIGFDMQALDISLSKASYKEISSGVFGVVADDSEPSTAVISDRDKEYADIVSGDPLLTTHSGGKATFNVSDHEAGDVKVKANSDGFVIGSAISAAWATGKVAPSGGDTPKTNNIAYGISVYGAFIFNIADHTT